MNALSTAALCSIAFLLSHLMTTSKAQEAGPSNVEEVKVVYKDPEGNVKWLGTWRCFKIGAFNARQCYPKPSPDFLRMAYLKCNDQWESTQAVVDGQVGARFDRVGEIKFSPDSKTVVYVAEADDLAFLVVNGKKGPPQENIGEILFSPDSKHLAYVASETLFLDGQEFSKHNYICDMKFSPDSQHFVYCADDGNHGRVLFLDGKKLDAFDEMGSIKFASDSQSLLYSYRNEKRWFMAWGAKRYGPYDQVEGIVSRISPDAKRIAFAARTGRDWFLVTSKERLGPYPWRPMSRFSPDSKHLLHFGGTNEKKITAFLDGQPLGTFDDISSGSAFSPDSAHCAFIAIRDGKSYLTVDGKFLEEADAFAYSPANGEIATILTAHPKLQVSYKGQKGNIYDCVVGIERQLVFSPDGQHIAYWAASGQQTILVIDGIETVRFSGPVYEGLHFTSDNRLRGAGWHRLKPDNDEEDADSTVAKFEEEMVNSPLVLFELIPATK